MNILDNEAWLRAAYATRSMESIAEELGVGRDAVRNRLVKFNIECRPKWVVMAHKPKSTEQRAKMSDARKRFWANADREGIAHNISRGKGGSGVTPRRQQAYRRMMGKLIGRTLRPDEHVHHIDKNPRNDSPENLCVLSAQEHSAIHGAERKNRETVVCPVCGTLFDVRKSHYHPRITCSRPCAGLLRRAPQLTKQCLRCRSAFTMLASQSHLRTFCSHGCAAAFHNTRRWAIAPITR